MKLYIAGPMTGLPDFNYPAFFEAEEQLKAAGYEVENPARNKPEGTASWLAYMRLSLVQISRVDGLAMLDGWSSSKGARLEEHIASALGMPVRYARTWLDQDTIASVRASQAQDPAVAVGPPLCPECAQGKPVNCALLALDPATDELVECATVGKASGESS